MGKKNPLWKILDMSGLVIGSAAISISLLDSLEVIDFIPDRWYPVVAVLLLSTLTLYIVLERRLVLDTLVNHVAEISKGATVEIVSERSQVYQYAIEAASEGTRSHPIRCVKIYAPLGFGQLYDDKQRWLDTLKQLVIAGRVIDVEAVYGLPQEKIDLAKTANSLMHFFYYTDSNEEEHTRRLRDHVFVRGIMLGGAGLGIPRGFGMIICEDRLLMIGYAMSRGDRRVQKSLVIHNKAAIKDMSDWFGSHVYIGGGLKVLQERKGKTVVELPDELNRILKARGIPKNTINKVLSNKLLSDGQILEHLFDFCSDIT